MIYLITGTPGAGKTLYAVSTLVQQLAGEVIEKDGVKITRRVVIDGIPNLLVPHDLMAQRVEPFDGKQVEGEHGLWNWWEWCKPGDIIVIDEVQRFWRPRGMGAKPPMEIQKLETHRHYGVDFVLITQNSMLIDQNVRRLVGRHQHIRRILGMKRAVIYDWDGTSTSLNPKSATATSYFSYPKSAYALYKSSELHTKQKQKIPLWVFVPLIAVVAGLFFLPKAFDVMRRTTTGKGLVQSAAPTPAPMASAPAVASSGPSAGAFPIASAPAIQASGASRNVAGVSVGCIVVRDRCECFDSFGKKMPSEPDACLVGAGVTGTPPAVLADDMPRPLPSAAELDAMAFSFKRPARLDTDKQLVSLSQIR